MGLRICKNILDMEGGANGLPGGRIRRKTIEATGWIKPWYILTSGTTRKFPESASLFN